MHAVLWSHSVSSGGKHGGGRPKLPPELKKVTVSYCLNPVLVKTIADTAIARKSKSISDLVEQILIEYFEE